MNDTILHYIFEHMNLADKQMKIIYKNIVGQRKVNKMLRCFMIATTINLVVLTNQQIEHDKKIRELENEIKKLKQSEGE